MNQTILNQNIFSFQNRGNPIIIDTEQTQTPAELSNHSVKDENRNLKIKTIKNQIKGQGNGNQFLQPQLKCKVCLLKFQRQVPAKFINVGKFQKYRYLCEQHSRLEPQLIPIDYSENKTLTPFIKNLTINNESDIKYKMLIESNFKQLVKDIMDQYYQQWKKSYLNWKKIIRVQYMAIMNTFDAKAIQRFVQNVINKDEDEMYEQELNFHAQSLRIAGSKSYDHLDEISQSLIQSYKELNSIFQQEIKKLDQRSKFIQGFLSQKRLEKIKSKSGNQSNQINQYVIDSEEEYQIDQVQKKQEYDGTQNVKQQYQQGQRQLVQIDVTIKNYKQIFYTLGPKKPFITKAIIRYQTPQIVQQTLMNLSLCNNLEELHIQEPLLGTKSIIFYIISTFPKLKRLYFNCFNQFDEECAEKVMNELPNIEKLFWGCNFYKSTARMAILRTWREHPKVKRNLSLDNQTLLKMINHLKNLQNIWISDVNSQSTLQLVSQLKNISKLKHLAVGQYSGNSQPQLTIQPKIWQQLSKVTSLQSLSLIKVQISDKHFIDLLANHKSTLRCLVLYDCKGLTDQSFKFLKQAEFKGLKELYLFRLGSRLLQGQFIWDLVQLQTLILRQCQFSHLFADEKVGRLKNLINFDLNGCFWVSDLFMSSVSKFIKNLQYLNLGHSNITFHTREHIVRLPKIRALDLGCTNINQAEIERICEANPRIEKLALYGLSGSAVIIGRGVLTKGKMHILGKLLKNCTHLNVGACDRLDDTSLDRFLKLQFVDIWNVKGISITTKQTLRQQGVVVFDQA